MENSATVKKQIEIGSRHQSRTSLCLRIIGENNQPMLRRVGTIETEIGAELVMREEQEAMKDQLQLMSMKS